MNHYLSDFLSYGNPLLQKTILAKWAVSHFIKSSQQNSAKHICVCVWRVSNTLPVVDCRLVSSHGGEGQKKQLFMTQYKGTNPIREASTYDLI